MDAYLIVDPDARTIDVPEVEKVFGVYGDNNAERKYFKCPRIVGNKVDLSKCYIYVNYISAATKVGQIMCDIGDVDGVDTNGDEIVFSWPITRNVLDKNESTNIFFAVQAKTTTGDTVFTTRKAEGFCYESIEGTETVAEEYADIVLQLISRMDNVEANIGEQVAAYFKENPAVTSEYLDQTLQPVKNDVSQLKEELGGLIQIIKGTYEKANTQNIKFPFIVGHEYEVRNTSESSAMEATAYDGNLQSVEKIGTINAGKSLKYVPSSNAAYLHFYMNGPGSFECEDITLKIYFLQQGLKAVEAKISDVENHVLKELPELIITPTLRNGSVPNLTNKNAIATLKTIPTNGCEKLIVKTSLKPHDGYYFYWAGAKYKNTGTDSSDNTGRTIVDPWSTEITNFEINVSDCAAFAISLTEKSKENPEILYQHRVELDKNAFTFVYCYGLNEISSRLKKVEESVVGDDSILRLDYSSLSQSMNGKVNFAVQADTHMSCYTNYRSDGNVFYANDFLAFEKVLRSIKKLECDAVIHLGDIVRGYEFDMDYETRESIDTIVKLYSKNFENMFFVIGNHDDGNMFYRRTEYNDHQSNENVLYPYEQFNRITKFGVTAKNNKNYYYFDINGIRLITLYQKDFIYKDNIPGNESFEIGVEQIEWFKTDALNTTNPVIVLTHAPLVSTLYESSGTGFSEVLIALQSFKTEGGTVIAVLSGHTHKQDYASVDNINHIVFDNGSTFFELVSVDLISRTVSCKPINNTSLQNRTFQYD